MRRGIVSLAGVLGAACAVALAAPAASARSLPLTYDLGIVMPGETKSMEQTVTVPRSAAVVGADFGSLSHSAGWEARLCAAQCVEVADLHGEVLEPGDYRLVVRLTMPDDGQPVLDASAEGSMLLSDVGVAGVDTLPGTGGSFPVFSMVLGAALASGGTALLLAAGRRRDRRQVSS